MRVSFALHGRHSLIFSCNFGGFVQYFSASAIEIAYYQHYMIIFRYAGRESVRLPPMGSSRLCPTPATHKCSAYLFRELLVLKGTLISSQTCWNVMFLFQKRTTSSAPFEALLRQKLQQTCKLCCAHTSCCYWMVIGTACIFQATQ